MHGPPPPRPLPASGETIPAFHVTFEVERGLLICCIRQPIGLSLLSPFATALGAAVKAARHQRPLRLLWDARSGHFLSMEATEIVRSIIGQNGSPLDRTAILVADASVPRALLSVTDASQLFEDEAMAAAWLHA